MKKSLSQNQSSGLKRLNSLSTDEAREEFRKCCGCAEWTQRMTADRPFENIDQLTEAADRIWWSLPADQWREAFHSHPKIGEKKSAAAISSDAQKWSEAEQAGTRDSAQETVATLARLNVEYEKRFGYIFIICASGKTAEEMLANLRSRLNNPLDEELRIAAAEQAKITELRLRKLISEIEK